MQLYNDRNTIIRLFENRNIGPSMYIHDAKFEPRNSGGVAKSEQKTEENIGERLKLRKQRSDELNKMITEKDEIINRDLFKKCFKFQSLSDM